MGFPDNERPLINSAAGAPHQQDTAKATGSTMPSPTHPRSADGGASVFAQLGASVLRCATLKLRKPASCVVELLLPILFALMLAWLSTLVSDEYVEGKIFVQRNTSSLLSYEEYVLNGTCFRHPGAGALQGADVVLDRLLSRCPAALGPTWQCGGDHAGQLSANLCYGREEMFALANAFRDLDQPAVVPSFDITMIGHYAALQVLGPDEGRFPQPTPVNGLRMTGRVWFTPDTPTTRALVARLQSANSSRYGATLLSHGWLGGFLESRVAALNYFQREENAGKAFASVDVEAFESGRAGFIITMNKTVVPWTNRDRNRFSSGAGSDYKLYYASGFLALQKSLLSAWNQLTLDDVNAGLPAAGQYVDAFAAAGDQEAISPMPFIGYDNIVFLQLAAFLVPLALSLSFLASVSQVAERLVQEKELRLREAMAAMGVSKNVLYIAWLIVFFGINFITATATTIALKATFIPQTDGFLLWLLFMLFAMATTTLGSLLSSLFSKSRTAAIATPIVFFACAIPSFALDQETQPNIVRPLMILSPTAFATGLKTILQYEQVNGAGLDDMFNPNDTIAIGGSIALLIFDTVIYALLTWYLDNVLGGEWGVRQHPCFCFLGCCKKHGADAVEDEELTPNGGPRVLSSASEPYPAPAKDAAVQIVNVTKEFGSGDDKKTAVSRMSLRIYPAMVTAVLGHNGAGKTTMFNMLTGMLPITSGDCFIFGSSITADAAGARQHIGMCPQHNILWDDLTCFEHLKYFAAVKGVPASQCAAAAEAMLVAVDLAEKRNARSASLSGGQKRKLSVGIAFIGGSRLVLLDEPTAGMDVHTRRATWELIQRMAREEGRAIILTTHFMDEAELLGDRVAMMAAGQLHSYGSTTYLKSTLGQAYTLNLQFAHPPSAAQREAVLSAVRGGGVAGAKEKEARGREQAVTLPMDDVARFAGVLRALEERREELGLSSFSMTAATIEDVFVAIAHADAKDVTDTSAAAGQTLMASKSNSEDSKQASIAATIASGDNAAGNPSAMSQFIGLMQKRFHNAKRDRRTLVLQIVLPVVCVLIAMALAETGPPDSPIADINPEVLPDPQEAVFAGCSDAVLAGAKARITTVNVTTDPSAYGAAAWLQREYNHHGGVDRTIGAACLDHSQKTRLSNAPTTFLFSNSTAYRHAAPFSMGLLSQARATAAMAAANRGPANLYLASEPFYFTARQSATSDSIANTLMAIFIVVPFSFLPSTFTSFIVRERASKAKLLQFVSGVGYGVYWLSNFIFDFASYVIAMVLAIVLFAAFGRDEYVGSGEAFGSMLLLFILYGVAVIPCSYVMSLPFNNHSTAQNAVLGIFFIAGFGFTLAGFLLELLEGPTELLYIFRLFPPAALGEGLVNIANVPAKAQQGVIVGRMDLDEAGWPMLYLGITAVVTTAAILFVDHPERTKRQQMLSYSASRKAPEIVGEPADVAAERLEVEAPGHSEGDDAYLKVVGLRKEYPAPAGSDSSLNVAVQNLTFRVPKGEIFGLLGTNGAGKTTTMNVITGETLPTMGRATVAGRDVVTDAGEARRVIGYCPQFDALHDLMTVDEHLALYCALRGVGEPKKVGDALTAALGLAEYRRVKSKSLSGGNKRKLSVAIAMIGAPRLLLLDEPTAGMDPVARRAMCDVVSAVSRHCAVVLTTHHLEEVEALADRAAIMVAGRMQCVGSLEHLKATLGEGYQVSLRLADEDRAGAVQARLDGEYPGLCKLVEQHQTRLRFTIKQGPRTTLSGLFQLLHDMKAGGGELGVMDYTVSQSSVEEVFLAVASGQEQHAAVTMPTSPVPAQERHEPRPPGNPIGSTGYGHQQQNHTGRHTDLDRDDIGMLL